MRWKGWSRPGAAILVPVALGGLLVARAGSGEENAIPVPRRGAAGEEADETRRDFGPDCLRSGCHSQIAKTRFVHSPVAVGACSSCHEPDGDAALHRFRPTRGEKDLCSFCHRPREVKEFVHTAYTEGKCTGCHDPHGGRNALYMKSEDVSSLCMACHDALAAHPGGPGADPVPFAFLHEPAAKGKCVDCHESHQSDHSALLTRPERELCGACHAATLAELGVAAHVHEPLSAGCSSCHDGHGGSDRKLLRDDERRLCLGCHPSVLEQEAAPGPVHAPVLAEASCLECHVGHAGSSRGLVTPDLRQACHGCHAREIVLSAAWKIRDVKAEVESARYVHEPVSRGDCAACHAGHASAHPDLLAHAYPEEMYAASAESAFDLCFACHDRRLATEERTEATAFRDGDRNLHRVHVAGQKGRTCAVCHEAHASDRPALTREALAFGPRGWRLAIGFRRTATGGACAPGCHQEIPYDRERPAAAPREPPGGADLRGDGL